MFINRDMCALDFQIIQLATASFLDPYVDKFTRLENGNTPYSVGHIEKGRWMSFS